MESKIPPHNIERDILSPMDGHESKLFLSVTTVLLADAVSTLAFYLTRTGVEWNPALRSLLNMNPFLVYPFLLSIVVPFILFRFNKVAQNSIALLIIATHIIATLNNVDILLYRHPLLLRFFDYSPVNVQWMGFIIGAVYISTHALYYNYKHRLTIANGVKLTILNYCVYLLAYAGLNLIPTIWQHLLI